MRDEDPVERCGRAVWISWGSLLTCRKDDPVAQLDKALGYEPRDWGFNSLRGRHFFSCFSCMFPSGAPHAFSQPHTYGLLVAARSPRKAGGGKSDTLRFRLDSIMEGRGGNLGYIEKNLIPGETVLYKTRLHWIVMMRLALVAAVLAAIGVALFVEGYEVKPGGDTRPGLIIGGFLCLVVAGVLIAAGIIRRGATEIAVSNKRVLIKRGLLSRNSIEVLLPKVESISVNESAFGRMLGYGDVILRGTGGTFETFRRIAHPNEFRRQVQQQTGGAETR